MLVQSIKTTYLIDTWIITMALHMHIISISVCMFEIILSITRSSFKHIIMHHQQATAQHGGGVGGGFNIQLNYCMNVWHSNKPTNRIICLYVSVHIV